MERIDSELRKAAVPIAGRSLNGATRYSRRFGLSFRFAKAGEQGTPGVFDDPAVDAHIRDWFERRYGKRQHADFGVGETVVLLRGEVWVVHLPRIYGSAKLLVDPRLSIGIVNKPGAMPQVNILSLIDDLPQPLAEQLTTAERVDILKTFHAAWQACSEVQAMIGHDFVAEARADIGAAVRHMAAQVPHHGQSKWASAQAAEKLLKALLKFRGVPYPKSHDIPALAALARTVGANVDDTLATTASASASARYGEAPVTQLEAVQAHYASLLVARHVYSALRS